MYSLQLHNWLSAQKSARITKAQDMRWMDHRADNVQTSL